MLEMMLDILFIIHDSNETIDLVMMIVVKIRNWNNDLTYSHRFFGVDVVDYFHLFYLDNDKRFLLTSSSPKSVARAIVGEYHTFVLR